MEKNYFADLNSVNVGDKTEKKNGLTYLSWSWAWAELKKRYPESTYTIYENANGLFYHTDGKTCWVKTGVTVNGIEHIEYLPVMDFKNKSIPLENVTSMDVNKAIQRSLTKAVARHGLGLYVYAGEDLPESDDEVIKEPQEEPKKKEAKPKTEPKADGQPLNDADLKKLGKQPIDEAQINTLNKLCNADKVPKEFVLSLYKVESVEEINQKQFRHMVDNWVEIIKRQREAS